MTDTLIPESATAPEPQWPTSRLDDASSRPRRKRWYVLGGIALALLLAAVGWFFFLRDNAPDRATSATAVEAARLQQDDAAAGASATGAAAPAEAAGYDGTYRVATSPAAVYPYEDASYVGYRVVEELAGFGAFTAVGRTVALDGSLEISGNTVQGVTIDADLTALTSDNGTRDGAMRGQALETDAFPTAVFELTSPIALPDAPADGETIITTATGNLTLHGVTRTVDFELEATPVGADLIVVVGRTNIEFADFDIDTPTAAVVVGIEDNGEIEVQLFLERV